MQRFSPPGRAAVGPHGVGNLPFGFHPPPENGYRRAPIPNRLKLFATDPITLDAATRGARASCDKARVGGSEYTITPLGSPGLCRLFAIDFVGNNEKTNALRAQKARECFRNEDSSWLVLEAPTTTGGRTKAYINVDKSPKVERVEKLPKMLLKNCQSELADTNPR